MKENPKFEIRNPNKIRRLKSEIIASEIFHASVFGILSDFGFRFSELPEKFFA